MSKKVVISSTVRDLPEHRKKALDAVIRSRMTPLMMEHLPSSDADAVAVSLKLVDDAEIYVGVYGFRYGHVPAGSPISITEMEYKRAEERGIPRLLFLMDEQHLIKVADVDKDASWAKVEVFRHRVAHELAGRSFRTPDELGYEMLHALSAYSTDRLPRPFMAPAADEGPLFGRDALLDNVNQRLLGGARNIALWGLPGIGKTALAVAVAHDPLIRAHFDDGVLWAGVGPGGSLFAALARWAEALDIRSVETPDASHVASFAQAIKDSIAGRRMLLVIDGAWEPAAVTTFKIGTGESAHLVTTPFPALATEAGRDGAIKVGELSPEAGAEYLRHVAPDAALDEATARGLAEQLGGLPLGIRLLGLHLRAAAASGGVRRVKRSASRLLADAAARLDLDATAPLGGAAGLSGNVSLSVVIETIAKALPGGARGMLSSLAVLPPSPSTFSVDVALTVSGRTEEDLDRLLDRGLVSLAAGERYAIHAVVRDFAATRMDDATAESRLIAFARDYCRTHRTDVAALDREVDALLVAWKAADRTDAAEALVDIAVAAAEYYRARGAYPSAVEYLARAEKAARKATNGDGLIDVLTHLGHIAEKQGEYDESGRRLTEALELCSPGDRRQIQILYLLGVVAWNGAAYDRASELLDRAAALAEDDQPALVAIDQRRGLVARERGRAAEALAFADQALGRARALPHQEEITAALLTDLAVLALQRDDTAAAAAHIEQGLSIARATRHTERTVGLLQLSSVLARRRGDIATAEADLREAVALARQIAHRWYLTTCLIDWGRLQGGRGETASARAALEEARMLGQGRFPDLHAFAGFHLAQLLVDSERETALSLARESERVLSEVAHGGAGEVSAWLRDVEQRGTVGTAGPDPADRSLGS